MAQPPKDANSFFLCKVGQQLVHEIVNKTTDLFNFLKLIHPPNGTQQLGNVLEEKKMKARDTRKSIDLLFQQLKILYQELESTSGFESVEGDKLIPYKDSSDANVRGVVEEKKIPDPSLIEERNRLLETLNARNEHLKLIIDNLRNLVWDINTMLAMRKP